MNVTVTEPTHAGHLVLYPADRALPSVSAINYAAGQTRANNATATLSEAGELAAYCGQTAGTAQLVLDVTGYFE